MNQTDRDSERLESVKDTWERLATLDPLWAILSVPDKRCGKWDLEEFLSTGRREIEAVLAHAAEHGRPREWNDALDFGCGVGRLTQPLCGRFSRVVGVDISPRMIELAREYNRHGGRCTYVENDSERLSFAADDSVDFVYSSLVLQHLRPQLSAQYVREFIRIIGPNGLAVFQLPGLPRATESEGRRYAATLTVEEPAVTMLPLETVTMTVLARNDDEVAWPGTVSAAYPGVVGIGNHWLTAAGEMAFVTDGRAHFVEDVLPGEERSIQIDVTAPAEPGQYLLEFDLVEEGVAWFADRGGATLRLPCTVGSPSDTSSDETEPIIGDNHVQREPNVARGRKSLEAKIEMHGLPRPWVEQLIGAAGGVLLEAMPVDWAGKSLESFLGFFVTKDEPRPPRETLVAPLGASADTSQVRCLNWGCGDSMRQGWVNSDVKDGPGIVQCDIREGLPFDSDSFDYVVSIHALPELPYEELLPALRELRRVLKTGGVLRLSLPDLEKGVEAYRREDRAYFLIPDEEMESTGGKLVAQLLWYGHSRTIFVRDFVEELLQKSGFQEVRNVAYRRTSTEYREIVELDNREAESLFMEAVK